jgi:thiol-disulfide isomerase/thioredoxin
MKHSKFLLAIILLFGGFSLFAQDNPVAWTLKIDSTAKTFKAGDNFNVQVSAKIEDGWNLYSTTKIENGPIETTISLPENQPFQQVGEITSPNPNLKFDENFRFETEYFTKAVTFTLPVKVLPNISPTNNKLTVQTRYQACNAEICLPPKLEKHELLIEVSANTVNNAPKQVGASQVKSVNQPVANKNQVTGFAFTDFNGKPRQFSEFKGKVVLLDFWATWCSPCLKDIPKLKVLYDKYKTQGFEIIGLQSEFIGDDAAPDAESIKEADTRAKQIVKTRNANWTQAIAEISTKLAKENFEVKALPTKILIDKDGNIVARIGEKDDLEKAIVAQMEKK